MKVLKSKPTQNTHPNILMRYYQDTKWFAILTKASLFMAERSNQSRIGDLFGFNRL